MGFRSFYRLGMFLLYENHRNLTNMRLFCHYWLNYAEALMEIKRDGT